MTSRYGAWPDNAVYVPTIIRPATMQEIKTNKPKLIGWSRNYLLT